MFGTLCAIFFFPCQIIRKSRSSCVLSGKMNIHFVLNLCLYNLWIRRFQVDDLSSLRGVASIQIQILVISDSLVTAPYTTRSRVSDLILIYCCFDCLICHLFCFNILRDEQHSAKKQYTDPPFSDLTHFSFCFHILLLPCYCFSIPFIFACSIYWVYSFWHKKSINVGSFCKALLSVRMWDGMVVFGTDIGTEELAHRCYMCRELNRINQLWVHIAFDFCICYNADRQRDRISPYWTTKRKPESVPDFRVFYSCFGCGKA